MIGLAIFLVIIFFGIIVIAIITPYNKLKRLREEYQYALRSKDRARAINSGRRYYEQYSLIKKVHIDIEPRISNDISTMEQGGNINI